LKKIELDNKRLRSIKGLKPIENNEEIFLKCINDVKNELVKNPQIQLSKSKSYIKNQDYSNLNISKTNLYLNPTSNHPHTTKTTNSDQEVENQKILENEVYSELDLDQNTTFEQFVNVDKARLLNLILNNE